MGWKTLDTKQVVDASRKQVETTSASVGGYAVPLGPAMRPPLVKKPRKKKSSE